MYKHSTSIITKNVVDGICRSEIICRKLIVSLTYDNNVSTSGCNTASTSLLAFSVRHPEPDTIGQSSFLLVDLGQAVESGVFWAWGSNKLPYLFGDNGVMIGCIHQIAENVGIFLNCRQGFALVPYGIVQNP